MGFMTSIVNALNSVSSWFYEIYLDVNGWVWPFYLTAGLFYQLCLLFNTLAWRFSDFGSWVNVVASKVSQILSWGTIWSYILSYVPNLTQIRDWFYHWWYNVNSVVKSWWSSTQYTVLSWIADAKSWSLAQVNSLRDTVLVWVADLKSWTTAQISTAQTLILDIISNIESWTTSQINSVRDAILAVVGDLSTWTISQINTISNTLTNLIDWGDLTTWITGWWNNRLLDIQGLINSAFTARDSLWAGWQEMRTRVVEFIEHPFDFLLERFTDWFLGPEV